MEVRNKKIKKYRHNEMLISLIITVGDSLMKTMVIMENHGGHEILQSHCS